MERVEVVGNTPAAPPTFLSRLRDVLREVERRLADAEAEATEAGERVAQAEARAVAAEREAELMREKLNALRSLLK